MTRPEAVPSRRGRQQSKVPLFDPVDPAMDDPVERQVYRSLRRGIMRGLVSPDMVLTGRSLAQHMNLSVQPVRDALKRLEADGIIVGRPQSGFHLPAMTAQEYWETIEIRTRLEGLAGRLAAGGMTPSLIADLRKLNAEMALLQDPHAYLAANFAFHFTIYSHAGRSGLLALIENFWVRIGPMLHHLPAQHSADVVLQRHENIIAALERNEPDRVEAAITEDLVNAAHEIVKGLR
jgi:GntR family transcriptional regulator, colanic acid and biofilm gene transcriptional regulator